MGFLKKIGRGLKKALPTIGAIAPTLATALGGPLAGTAAHLLKKALGKNDATEDDIASLILGGDPETMVALKNAEHEFKLKMRELDITEEQLRYADIDSARQREIAVRDATPSVLSYLAVGLWLGIMAALFFINDLPILDGGNKEILFLLLGTTGALVTQAYGYYLGSSRGSKIKDDAIRAALNGKQ